MPNRVVISPSLKPSFKPDKLQLPELSTLSLDHSILTQTPINDTFDPTPTIKVLKQSDYVHMPWKNGLGETHQIAIHPPTTNFENEEFTWRLASSEVRGSCSFSVFPGYDIALFLLPPDNGDQLRKDSLGRRTSLSSKDLVAIHHNDQATSVPLRVMQPYTYSGEWSTACRIASQIKHLTLIANRNRCRVTANLETICLHGLSDDGECNPNPNGKKKANPTSKLLLGNFTIVYVVSGAIRVNVEGDQVIVLKGETIVCEREDETSPTDFIMTPVKEDGTEFDKDGDEDDHQDAKVFIIQVTLLPQPITTSRTSSLAELSPIHPRGRAGSIILYDEQPFQPTTDSSLSLSLPQTPSAEIPFQHYESARHYRPPIFSYRYESELPPAVVRDRLVVEEFERGKISTVWINVMKQGLSEWIRVPVIVARGKEDGPVVGLTAVVHGNELNGVPCIHRVITDINTQTLCGTVVAVPCMNVPGYLRFRREFSDGKDLNRLFPGKEDGTASQIYAYNLMEKIVKQFEYLIDLHTASFGRVNSYYVRSDLNDPIAATMAKLQQPQIILHSSGQDGALRSAAMSLSIPSITVEIGNPQLFQSTYVQWSYLGILRILSYLNMFKIKDLSETIAPPPTSTIICSKGYWIYTKTGGVLEVYPGVNTVIRKGDLIARIKNIFGGVVDEIFAPGSGVTIGRSSNPVASAGDRVLHMGVIKKEGEVLAKEAKENY